MLAFSQTADRIAGTTKKLVKIGLVADYFKSVTGDDATAAAVFFSGRPFPLWEQTTLQVGGALLWRVLAELSGKSDEELTAVYREHGDIGAVVEAVLPSQPDNRGGTPGSYAGSLTRGIHPSAVQSSFREIAAARGPAAKAILVRRLLGSVSPLEAKYIVKIMTGDLRIGLKESLVEEAIAKAHAAPLPLVQRANTLLGDIGETLKLAAEGLLAEARMRLFHPIGFMLASPAASADDALSYFQNAWVEDKYDGIRAQAHGSGKEVRFFSRTRDEITESFPELPYALVGLPQDAILDGEIVAWSYLTQEESGRALPFSALQRRLGRKKVSDKLVRDVPVVYLAFDILYADGELLIDRPLRERAKILDRLLAARTPVQRKDAGAWRRTLQSPQAELSFTPESRPTGIATQMSEDHPALLRAPVLQASSSAELDQLFDAAQARGNEGLMIKDPESLYSPGRRGKSWLKLKRELATLDVVVTAVEYGHGKRIGVLSDYTFAVRENDRLLNIGKAYSGLTDAEILEMTKWFLEHTTEDQGFRRIVEPRIVLEVAFNNIMKSNRHNSGYALRFPRIVRLRPDKLPEEADTLERATEIFRKQTG